MIRPETVYLNGQFISHDRASISPDDRGFYFADGVYEVVKFYKNRPFCFKEHMDRLSNSLNEIRINFPDISNLREISLALIAANELKRLHAGIYIQITRGVAKRIHRFPSDDVKPTIYARAFHMPVCITELAAGVTVMTREDIRWLKCNVKSIALLPNTLLFEDVASKGAFECVLIRNGLITEASHSNILAVKNGIVHTHPDSNLILPGITKMAVLRICKDLGIKVVEKPIIASSINGYDEWFLTGTGSEVMPVTKIDDHVFGNGHPGPVTRRIQKEFFRITYEELAGEKMDIEN
jgi:D-alanine transaminase